MEIPALHSKEYIFAPFQVGDMIWRIRYDLNRSYHIVPIKIANNRMRGEYAGMIIDGNGRIFWNLEDADEKLAELLERKDDED